MKTVGLIGGMSWKSTVEYGVASGKCGYLYYENQ